MQKGELNQEDYYYGGKQDNENWIQDMLGRYLPQWLLFAILVAVGILASLIYLRYATPVYESSSSLLIKDEKKGIDDSGIMESLNLFGSKKIVENEIEIIQSRAIAREVAKSLYLYAPVKQKGRIKDVSAYILSPVIVEAKNPDSLYTEKNIPFSYNSGTGKILFGGKEYAIGEWIKAPFGTVRFMANNYYRDGGENKPFYFSVISMKKAVSNLLENLDVSPSSKQSTVINLNYKDAVPQRGENILNELVTAYNRAAVNDKNQLASNTLAFVEDRLRYVVNELDSVEHKLERFKTKNRIVDISEQGKQFLQNVGTNDQKVGELSMQLAVLNQVESYVSSKNKSAAIVPSTLGITDPVLSQLLDKLYTLEMQYEKMKTTTAENNPLLISVTDQIERIRPNILENIRNQRRSLEAGRTDMGITNNHYASMLQALPTKERELLDISRQQSIKNSIYTFLLQKREESALSYASTVADSRIIDKAESTEKPVSPRKLIVFAIALAIAFGAGIGFIEIKEVINRNVMFRSEIEKYTKVPVLGEISKDKTNTPLVIAEGKRTFVAEQFRQLRTSLGYLGINSRKKKILITSSVSGEGKSFISANLGVSLALIGKKVILVELDLRKPKLSEIFNVSRQTGISNYFIGDKNAEDIIKSTGTTNLFLVPSGPVPPNPSELILNGRMQELLSYLEKQFDYIIIDTAPVSPVTDAYILSPMCDATLFVIRHAYTPRVYLKKLDEQNRIRELKNMAIIFNGVQNKGYGNYGYGYGYAYTEEHESKKKKTAPRVV